MTLRVFNTLSGKKEPFVPQSPVSVKLYVCGPTVYDDPHLGHARSAVVFDVMVRYLEARGRQAVYVRNLTDIDDKIIHKAGRENRDFRGLARYYALRYRAAMDRIGVRPPDIEPRVSEYIRPIQDFISKLIQRGHAYSINGNVWFSVQTFPRYGRLSGRPIPPAEESADAATEIGKRHPADFALWKGAGDGEPSWPSPWGAGRPGWHIECSTMSVRLLGERFDIHGGGADLIFPHHENEIAQSESLTGKTPAAYWIHNGLVTIGGEKMAKSIGNSLKLNDLSESYPPDALRLFLLSKRYRHPLSFSHDRMIAATRNAARLQRFFARTDLPPVSAEDGSAFRTALWDRFCEAMDDDFNFPKALSVVFSGLKTVSTQAAAEKQGRCRPPKLGEMRSDLCRICRTILGLSFEIRAVLTAPAGIATERDTLFPRRPSVTERTPIPFEGGYR